MNIIIQGPFWEASQTNNLAIIFYFNVWTTWKLKNSNNKKHNKLIFRNVCKLRVSNLVWDRERYDVDIKNMPMQLKTLFDVVVKSISLNVGDPLHIHFFQCFSGPNKSCIPICKHAVCFWWLFFRFYQYFIVGICSICM